MIFFSKLGGRIGLSVIVLKIFENSQKLENILRILRFLWKFHISIGNSTFSHKKSTFRPCLKYQVLPSVSIGILGTYRENT